MLLSAFTTQEAVLSSQIEGTLTSLEEVLQDNAILAVLREASGCRPAILVFQDLIELAEGRK